MYVVCIHQWPTHLDVRYDTGSFSARFRRGFTPFLFNREERERGCKYGYNASLKQQRHCNIKQCEDSGGTVLSIDESRGRPAELFHFHPMMTSRNEPRASHGNVQTPFLPSRIYDENQGSRCGLCLLILYSQVSLLLSLTRPLCRGRLPYHRVHLKLS